MNSCSLIKDIKLASHSFCWRRFKLAIHQCSLDGINNYICALVGLTFNRVNCYYYWLPIYDISYISVFSILHEILMVIKSSIDPMHITSLYTYSTYIYSAVEH